MRGILVKVARLGDILLGMWDGTGTVANPALEAALVDAVRRARDAWPDITVTDETFVAYLARRVPPTCADVVGELARLRISDLYLACAASQGDTAALAAFEVHFLAGTSVFLQHINSSPAFVDEVKQLLRGRLLLPDPDGGAPRISQYAGRGPLAKWLGVAAQRTALGLLRADRARQRATNEAVADALPVGHDPELDYLRVRYRDDFRAAFGAAIEALTARDRVILRLHVVDRLSHERIAIMYRVNQSTVTRWIAAARQRILHDVHRVLRERLRVETSELDSLAAVVGQDLDLSLSRLLGAAAAPG